MMQNKIPALTSDFDGIQEYMNPIPRWWKSIFLCTLAIVPFYILRFHSGAPGTTLADQFQSEMDENTRKQIERGQRVTELMKQNQYSPMSVAQMAISLFAANEGFLDNLEVNKVLDFEAALQSYMTSEHSELMNNINATGDFSDDIRTGMLTAIQTFVKTHSW